MGEVAQVRHDRRADRLLRTTVDGAERSTSTYLRVTVTPRGREALRTERVPVS